MNLPRNIIRELNLYNYHHLRRIRKQVKVHPRTGKIILVDDYNRNGLRGRVDNMNVVTEGLNTSSSPSSSYPKIRVPSKKHKNRYKNFLKLFPNYEK